MAAKEARIGELTAALEEAQGAAQAREAAEADRLARKDARIAELEAQAADQLEKLRTPHAEMQRRDEIIETLRNEAERGSTELATLNETHEHYAIRNRELEDQLMRAREELRRAEGQVELIKDLLLREPGL